MLIDIHLHSQFSFDSKEKPEKFIKEAKRLSVPIIGFSEHYDYDAVLDGENIPLANLPLYVKKMEELRKSGDAPEILCGIEFGYRDAAEEKYKEIINNYNLDYSIYSVHTLKGKGDCFHNRFFDGQTLKESYQNYFNAVLDSVKSEVDYQIIGHIGYVSRYRKEDGAKIAYSDFKDIIDEILYEIIWRGKCLEINTSVGSSKSRFLPDCDIIERYLEFGGELLSFGSDAHCANDYLRRGGEVSEYLGSIGVKYLFYYKNRKPIAYKF